MENKFETADLALACYLETEGFRICDINTKIPAQSIFFFETTPKLEEKVQLFYSGGAVVNPLFFFATIKKIKAKIFRKDE